MASTKKNIAQVVATKKAVTVYGIKAGKTKITAVVNAEKEGKVNVSIAVSVDTLEVKSNSAAVAIESGKTVDNLKVAAGVTSVAVSGEGTLQAVDLTEAGNAVAGLTVTVPEETCNQVYAVGEPFDIENFYIKVTYSDNESKTLPVSADM